MPVFYKYGHRIYMNENNMNIINENHVINREAIKQPATDQLIDNILQVINVVLCFCCEIMVAE